MLEPHLNEFGILRDTCTGNKKQNQGGYNAVSSNHMALDAFVTLCKELLNQSEFAILFNQSDPVTVPPLEEIKTEHLQDIIQYSGINLKEEAENMVKDSEDYIGVYCRFL